MTLRTWFGFALPVFITQPGLFRPRFAVTPVTIIHHVYCHLPRLCHPPPVALTHWHELRACYPAVYALYPVLHCGFACSLTRRYALPVPVAAGLNMDALRWTGTRSPEQRYTLRWDEHRICSRRCFPLTLPSPCVRLFATPLLLRTLQNIRGSTWFHCPVRAHLPSAYPFYAFDDVAVPLLATCWLTLRVAVTFWLNAHTRGPHRQHAYWDRIPLLPPA